MIESRRLLLREWKESDLEVFAAMGADEKVMEHFPATLTTTQSAEFVARIRQHIPADRAAAPSLPEGGVEPVWIAAPTPAATPESEGGAS